MVINTTKLLGSAGAGALADLADRNIDAKTLPFAGPVTAVGLIALGMLGGDRFFRGGSMGEIFDGAVYGAAGYLGSKALELISGTESKKVGVRRIQVPASSGYAPMQSIGGGIAEFSI